MTKTITTEQALESISTSKADPELRVTRRMEIGQAIQQGDVYLHRVADDHPRGKAWGSRQVAVGQQVGARHVVEGDGVEVFAGERLPEDVTEPEWVEPGAMLGPVIVSPKPFTLTHPEHAHHRLPAGVYQVTYQADATTRRRVID